MGARPPTHGRCLSLSADRLFGLAVAWLWRLAASGDPQWIVTWFKWDQVHEDPATLAIDRKLEAQNQMVQAAIIVTMEPDVTAD